MTKIVNLLLALLLIVGLTAVPAAAMMVSAPTSSSDSVKLVLTIMDSSTGTVCRDYSETTLTFSDGSTMKQASYYGYITFTFPRSRLSAERDTVVTKTLFYTSAHKYGIEITWPINPSKTRYEHEAWTDYMP